MEVVSKRGRPAFKRVEVVKVNKCICTRPLLKRIKQLEKDVSILQKQRYMGFLGRLREYVSRNA